MFGTPDLLRCNQGCAGLVASDFTCVFIGGWVNVLSFGTHGS
jgi:hypothetical protein